MKLSNASEKTARPPAGARFGTGNLLAKFASAPHIVWSVLFIIVPLVFVAYYSFTDAEMNFTLANITEFFTLKYLKILGRSVKLALIATVVCLLIGYPAAYFISKVNPNVRIL